MSVPATILQFVDERFVGTVRECRVLFRYVSSVYAVGWRFLFLWFGRRSDKLHIFADGDGFVTDDGILVRL